MEFLKKIEWTPLNILKGAAVVLVGLFVLSFVLKLTGVEPGYWLKNDSLGSVSYPGSAPAYNRVAYDTDDMSEEAYYEGDGEVRLSLQNIGVPTPEPGGTVGGDAEDYEVTSYSASIEARDSKYACSQVADLKGLQHVVFESANEYEQGCDYSFKVENEKVAEVLAVIEALDPTDLSESTYTIKRQLDDFTSETEILEKKLAVIEETLETAVTAYDEITTLATRTQDAESLANVIDSKVRTIERLTQQRISVVSQLERLSRGKAEQLDRLVYTYFHVNVRENKLIDGESVKDSWERAVKGFVRDINTTAQDVTINLLAFMFMALQYTLYFFILLFLVKYVWQAALSIWKK